MAGNSKIRLIEKCGANLDSQAVTNLEVAGTYYSISGTFSDGLACGFTLSEDGIITYNGAGGTFLFNGSSDLKADKTCEVTYALFLNGVNTGKTTPTTFNNANSFNDIAITGLVNLNRGDTLQVKAKSNTSNTTLTVANLRTTYWGE